MLTNTWLRTACAVLLLGGIGCGNDKKADAVTGTTATMAAEALTKAVSFTGGELVDGLLPASTDSDVSLLPAADDSIAPGTPGLMSFDVTPVDAAVSAALIQFGGASGHFEIDSSAFSGAADGGTGDGGTGASLHVVLSYEADDSVCEKLCDTKYEIEVTQALRLRGDKISKRAKAKLTLDCTGKGDHSLCEGAKPAGGGVKPGTSAKPTPMQVAAGACNMTAGDAGCTGLVEYQACVAMSCKATYETCLGKNYQSGDYSGSVCEAYARCNTEAADPCNADCTIDEACQTCFADFSNCATQCVSLLDCGGLTTFPDAGDIGGGKTCADLDACCASLSGDTKASCEMYADQIRPSGDMFCGAAVPAFCP